MEAKRRWRESERSEKKRRRESSSVRSRNLKKKKHKSRSRSRFGNKRDSVRRKRREPMRSESSSSSPGSSTSSSSESQSSSSSEHHRHSGFQKNGSNRKRERKSSHTETTEQRSASPAVEIDKDEKLLEIAAYMEDRTAMTRHLFASLSREEFRSLLPNSLKDLHTKELFDLCVEQLEGMSKKRVTAVLEGHDLLESSDSPESEPEETKDRTKNDCRPSSPQIAVADSTTGIALDEELLDIPVNKRPASVITEVDEVSVFGKCKVLEDSGPGVDDEEGCLGVPASSTAHAQVATVCNKGKLAVRRPEDLEDGEVVSDDEELTEAIQIRNDGSNSGHEKKQVDRCFEAVEMLETFASSSPSSRLDFLDKEELECRTTNSALGSGKCRSASWDSDDSEKAEGKTDGFLNSNAQEGEASSDSGSGLNGDDLSPNLDDVQSDYLESECSHDTFHESSSTHSSKNETRKCVNPVTCGGGSEERVTDLPGRSDVSGTKSLLLSELNEKWKKTKQVERRGNSEEPKDDTEEQRVHKLTSLRCLYRQMKREREEALKRGSPKVRTMEEDQRLSEARESSLEAKAEERKERIAIEESLGDRYISSHRKGLLRVDTLSEPRKADMQKIRDTEDITSSKRIKKRRELGVCDGKSQQSAEEFKKISEAENQRYAEEIAKKKAILRELRKRREELLPVERKKSYDELTAEKAPTAVVETPSPSISVSRSASYEGCSTSRTREEVAGDSKRDCPASTSAFAVQKSQRSEARPLTLLEIELRERAIQALMKRTDSDET